MAEAITSIARVNDAQFMELQEYHFLSVSPIRLACRFQLHFDEDELVLVGVDYIVLHSRIAEVRTADAQVGMLVALPSLEEQAAVGLRHDHVVVGVDGESQGKPSGSTTVETLLGRGAGNNDKVSTTVYTHMCGSQSMKTMTLTEARNQLLKVADEMQRRPDEVVEVMKRGKRVMTLLSAEVYAAIIETLEVVADEKAFAKLRRAMTEIEEGKGLPWSTARRKLGLRD
jgi:PHD/YefM family antitoxin component YafN of YafNO toxin-antitoxin module